MQTSANCTAANLANFRPGDHWMGDWSMHNGNADLVENPTVIINLYISYEYTYYIKIFLSIFVPVVYRKVKTVGSVFISLKCEISGLRHKTYVLSKFYGTNFSGFGLSVVNQSVRSAYFQNIYVERKYPNVMINK